VLPSGGPGGGIPIPGGGIPWVNPGGGGGNPPCGLNMGIPGGGGGIPMGIPIWAAPTLIGGGGGGMPACITCIAPKVPGTEVAEGIMGIPFGITVC
jgi:hypothetical protein